MGRADGSNGSTEYRLHDIQTDLGLKFANKLSDAHLKFSRNKMKVRVAAQTLSSSGRRVGVFDDQS